VLFFTRGEKARDNTKEVWVYDLRADAPAFGKRTELTRDYFAGFEKAFGIDPLGSPAALKKRKDQGEEGKFRRFTREWIQERDDNLDISWLRHESERDGEEPPEPTALARDAIGELEGAIEELQAILLELGEEEVV
jgi:type I restriction enzyme M protein